MVFRLTRVRIKAEWLLMIIALVLLILYIRFCSADIRNSTDLYSYTQFEYRYTANLSSYDERGRQIQRRPGDGGESLWDRSQGAARKGRPAGYI